MKPDYRRIAELEVETWGEVHTKEAKQFDPVFIRYRRGIRESDTTLDARANEMEQMLQEYGVE